MIAHSDGTKSQLQNRCHSFNTDKGVWEEVCQTVYDQNDPDSRVLCLCKHNTSFAVLMVRTMTPPINNFINLSLRDSHMLNVKLWSSFNVEIFLLN